jgi:hypothetical protein
MKSATCPRRILLLTLLATVLAVSPHTLTAASSKALPCGEVSDQALFVAITKAYSSFASKWLVIGEDWFSSYTVKMEDKNPLLPGRVPAKQVSGFVWTKDVNCTAAFDKRDNKWTMRISGRHIKFNEEGGGWIKAVKKGALAEYQFEKSEGGWTIKDRSAEVSVLGGDDAETRPQPKDLPSRQMNPKR